MSELLQIGLVAEGHTDFVIIEAALSAILDCSFVLTLLQPEPTQPTLGSGWSGVLKWCHETSKRHSGVLENDPTLATYDLLIIHLDVDVSGFDYSHCGHGFVLLAREQGWEALPCNLPCPPVCDSVNALTVVLESWLGTVTIGPHSVLCLPAQSTGTWLAASVLSADHQLLQNAQCDPTVEDRLAQLPKGQRIKKSKREYQRFAQQVTEKWAVVKTKCSQAEAFENGIRAAL